ncbi:CatA-like O-acetyltransferase [Granulicella tundricola]|uniref:Chloramphenicol acetyltransferase n=1 Tax=Granulicella tundricola (strain ATCC BAA-1859 / DSM 23138 / MP5ACTX9) TaxID=1198114 RepID=E8X5C2_GRATM|nr:CatA-like O-acetyltransferase [Granulicella tundricola]ADW69469.1 chloramphenicol acetyltransferase [Granulicella tundricola MP5ACTX9]
MQHFENGSGQKIDLETWNRRATFQLFKDYSEPYHGVCLRVDCTATYRFARQNHISVFLSLVHRSLLAANQVENFRTRIVDGTAWHYDQINAGSAVGRANGTIGFGHYPFHPRMEDFVREGSVELERVRQREDLERYPDANLIRYSVLPWFDFTAISHAHDVSRKDSAPHITFGKITESNGRAAMPVSIHVHHALADGLHVAQFVEKFEQALADPAAEVF